MTDQGFDDFAAALSSTARRDLRTPEGFAAALVAIRASAHTIVPSGAHARSIVRGVRNRWDPAAMTVLLVLECEGLVELDHDDEYILAVLQVAMTPLRDHLVLNDGPFRQRAIWRLFGVAGGGEISLSNFDKYYERSGGWGTSFVSYVTSGALPRARVLQCCLEALSRGFGSYVSGWFSTLYGWLEPTPDELATHEKLLRTLLSSTTGATVTLAVAALSKLADHGRLETSAFLASIVDVSTMTAANARVIARIATAADGEENVETVASLMEQAVAHRDRGVQKTATVWLAAHDRSDVIDRAGALLSPVVAAASGVRLAAAAAHAGSAAEREWSSIKRIPDSELLEHFAVLLEDCTDPLAVEAGLAALAASTEPRQLTALAPRARRAVPVNKWQISSVRTLVANLVLAAAGEDLPIDLAKGKLPPLVHSRFAELRLWALRGEGPHELLATPDDASGFIAAESLHDRLSRSLEVGRPIWHADFVSALLRVRLDGIARAKLAGEAGAALHYALGGEPGRIVTKAWWVAAARSRQPFDHDTALEKARLRLDGQAAPVCTELGIEMHEWSNQWASGITPKFALQLSGAEHVKPGRRRTSTAAKRKWIEDEPTVLALGPVKFGTEIPEDVVRLIGLTWPHSSEFLAGVALAHVAGEVAYDSVSYGATGAFWALKNSGAPLGPLGRSLLVLGLSAKNRGDRAVAAETLADALPGRATPKEFASSMARLAPGVKVTRWPAALVDAASISSRARAAVVELLSELLPLLDHSLHGLGALVELLEDELVRARGEARDSDLRDWLSAFAGSSKAAKSARGILALNTSGEKA